jgi:hypothetical protein
MADEGQSAQSLTVRASYAAALLTVLSIGVGVGLVLSMGVTSGAGVAAATPETRESALPLLVIAEILKMASGLVVAAAVRGCRKLFATSPLTTGAGYIGAALIFAAGVAGLIAVLTPAGVVLAWPVVLLGFGSAAVTGCWAAMMASGAHAAGSLPATLKWLGIGLGVLGVVSLVLPPVALLFGLLSLIWWFGLGRQISRRPA